MDCMAADASRVRERIILADNFVLEFFRGIAMHFPPVALPFTNEQIAEFADIPLGNELRCLRSASANLEY